MFGTVVFGILTTYMLLIIVENNSSQFVYSLLHRCDPIQTKYFFVSLMSIEWLHCIPRVFLTNATVVLHLCKPKITLFNVYNSYIKFHLFVKYSLKS
jgi:hypothetical protein